MEFHKCGIKLRDSILVVSIPEPDNERNLSCFSGTGNMIIFFFFRRTEEKEGEFVTELLAGDQTRKLNRFIVAVSSPLLKLYEQAECANIYMYTFHC